jgi:hypothetical protein
MILALVVAFLSSYNPPVLSPSVLYLVSCDFFYFSPVSRERGYGTKSNATRGYFTVKKARSPGLIRRDVIHMCCEQKMVPRWRRNKPISQEIKLARNSASMDEDVTMTECESMFLGDLPSDIWVRLRDSLLTVIAIGVEET